MTDVPQGVFEFSTAQSDFRAAVRQFADSGFASESIRQLMETDTGYDEGTWSLMARQLGLQGLIVPERYDGAGAGQVELAIVAEELGKRLAGVPFLSTVVLATQLILACGDEDACAAYLPAIAAGDLVATVMLGVPQPTQPVGTARSRDGEWTIGSASGTAIDGAVADLIVLVADTDDGPGVFVVPADAGGIQRVPLRSIDLTRKQARINLENVSAKRICATATAAVVSDVCTAAARALAAESLGVAQHCLDDAVGYAAERVQFGRAIGSFQAVKHTCADLYVEVELARSAAYYAAWAADDGQGADPSHVAHAWCTDTAVRVATENIQIHGGIGITWEHDAHLYLRRAKANQLTLGGTDRDIDLLATALRHSVAPAAPVPP